MNNSPKSASSRVELSPQKSTEGVQASPSVDTRAVKVLDLYAKGKTVKQILNHHSLVDTGITEDEVKEIISKSESMQDGESPRKGNYQMMAQRQAILLVHADQVTRPDIPRNQLSPGKGVVTDALKVKILDLHSNGKSAKQISTHFSISEFNITEAQVQQVIQEMYPVSSTQIPNSETPPITARKEEAANNAQGTNAKQPTAAVPPVQIMCTMAVTVALVFFVAVALVRRRTTAA